MKRIMIVFCILFAILLMAFGLGGCQETAPQETASNHKLTIVCTIFPAYDWTREILGSHGENVELILLAEQGADLHSYQPTPEDMLKISACDLFIYVGGESEAWADQALAAAGNEQRLVINLLEALGTEAKREEIIEGMEHDHEHDEHEEHEEHDHEHEEAYDEHVWLSLPRAQDFCRLIATALCSLDKAGAPLYEENLAQYQGRLEALHQAYRNDLEKAASHTLLFGDRFPFRYLLDDYGLNYYAAFSGCSAETEASFATIVFLAEKVDELSLKTILVTESSDQAIASTIRDNTRHKNQQIMVLNSLQSVNKAAIEGGAGYLNIMEGNLQTLKAALN